jgi:hypothetical protein
MIGAIQTFGDLIHWHPHIHALVCEGVFLPEGTFLPLPKLATEPFLKLWEQEVFKLLLAEGKITEEVVANIRGWQHSGFSVDQSVRVEAKDTEGLQRLNSVVTPSAKEARKRWAALIKQVYEIDPLLCPKCGAEMNVIAFIERRQRDVIEKILRHCGLWEEAPARDPPSVPEPVMG